MFPFITEDQISQKIKDKYLNLFEYLNVFLTSPHPGRDGPVCPFIGMSRHKKTLFFRFVNGVEFEDIDNIIYESVDFHLKNNINKVGALVLVFDFPIESVTVNLIQRKHKLYCVEKGLMIGSLNSDNNSESVRLKNFYPLRSPSPIIVIRDMVYSDLTFLKSNVPVKDDRKKFLESYIKKFGTIGAKKVINKVLEAKERLSKLSKKWLFF